jgi:glycosyltransferase involved in cell wall biosynthesis
VGDQTKRSLSYVIPVYNGAKFIGRTVCSIISQSAVSPPIIVVDDGSIDDTVDILSKYENYITILRQENSGASAARNRGLSAVTTELVCFVDADDYVVGPHCRSVENKYNGDVDIIIGLDAIGNDNKISLSQQNKFPINSTAAGLLKNFINGYYVQTATLCWSASFLKKIGGWDETLIGPEDIELAVRAFAREPRVMISNAPGWVVWHDHDGPGRLTRMRPQTAKSMVRANAKYIEIVESINFDRGLLDDVLRGCMRDGRSLYLNGYLNEAKELFSLARRKGCKIHYGPRMESLLAAGLGTEKTLAARRSIGRLKRAIFSNAKQNQQRSAAR